MSSFVIQGASGIRGSFSLPGDKSISHRSIILGSLAPSPTVIRNFPLNEDCRSTVNVFRCLGVPIAVKGTTVTVKGRGLLGLRPPSGPLFIRESGTTLRLLLGVLAGQPFDSTVKAGPRLSRRPMLRVAAPLRLMGASCRGRVRGSDEFPPFSVRGGCLVPITYTMPVASAQVKSAILLAGLYASGTTTVIEKFTSRDHTERILRLFGARVKVSGKRVRVTGGGRLRSPGTIRVPGDISSAAFFIVLATIVPGSDIVITDVGVNPTRAGILKVLKRMGADIRIRPRGRGPEPSADIRVRSARLRAVTVKKAEIPFLIDELPVLMVAAACAKGTSVFRSAGELRVKETDRISSMLANLRAMGVPCRASKTPRGEDIEVTGVPALSGARVSGFGDHRTAMSMAVAGAAARGRTTVSGVECIEKSFPGFLALLERLTG